MPETITDTQFLAEALADIRQTISDIASLFHHGQLATEDMDAAVLTIETNCTIVEAVAVQVDLQRASASSERRLPLLTLAEVAARHRAIHQGARPAPQSLQP